MREEVAIRSRGWVEAVGMPVRERGVLELGDEERRVKVVEEVNRAAFHFQFEVRVQIFANVIALVAQDKKMAARGDARAVGEGLGSEDCGEANK